VIRCFDIGYSCQELERELTVLVRQMEIGFYEIGIGGREICYCKRDDDGVYVFIALLLFFVRLLFYTQVLLPAKA
jgi:hypothetical protein